MSESHSMVRVRRTDYICDHCGEGMMTYTGSWFENQQAKVKLYFHRCEVCGVQVSFPKAYPLTDFQTETPQ